jgi:hypothetical protein
MSEWRRHDRSFEIVDFLINKEQTEGAGEPPST